MSFTTPHLTLFLPPIQVQHLQFEPILEELEISKCWKHGEHHPSAVEIINQSGYSTVPINAFNNWKQLVALWQQGDQTDQELASEISRRGFSPANALDLIHLAYIVRDSKIFGLWDWMNLIAPGEHWPEKSNLTALAIGKEQVRLEQPDSSESDIPNDEMNGVRGSQLILCSKIL